MRDNNYWVFYYNDKTIEYFYDGLEFNDFEEISDERTLELNYSIKRNYDYLRGNCGNFASLYSRVAEKMNTSSKRLGFITDDEKIYCLITVLDSKLDIYEASKNFDNLEEFINYCVNTYGIYDKRLLDFEEAYIQKFRTIDSSKKR